MLRLVTCLALVAFTIAVPSHLHNDCKYNGQFLENKHDECSYLRCDYGEEPWYDQYGNIRFIAIKQYCAPGTSTRQGYGFDPYNPCSSTTYKCKGHSQQQYVSYQPPSYSVHQPTSYSSNIHPSTSYQNPHSTNSLTYHPTSSAHNPHQTSYSYTPHQNTGYNPYHAGGSSSSSGLHNIAVPHGIGSSSYIPHQSSNTGYSAHQGNSYNPYQTTNNGYGTHQVNSYNPHQSTNFVHSQTPHVGYPSGSTHVSSYPTNQVSYTG